MRVGCVICGDLFVVSDDVAATPCGHTFHAVCLIQWIERSKSCPQCRHRVTERNILKLFFDSSSPDTQVDPDTLQHQIDNMKFQIRLKEQEISTLKDDNKVLSERTKALREEYKIIEKQLKDKETTNMALKSQLKYLDQLKAETEFAKLKAKKLEVQVSVLENVQTILSGTNEDVENMLMSYGNDDDSVRALATFCSLLKKELNKTVDDKKRFRDENSSLRSTVRELRNSCKSAEKQLKALELTNKLYQDDVLALEAENKTLKKKVNCLQDAIASPSGDVKNSALHRLIAESPAPEQLKRPHSSQIEDELLVFTPEVVRKMARQDLNESIQYLGTNVLERESSPKKKTVNLPGRKPFAVTTNLPRSQKQSHNIFAKNKPSINLAGNSQPSGSGAQGSEVGYDGLGGHHKVDDFPLPRPTVLVPKMKGSKASRKTTVKVVSNSGFGSKAQKTTLKDYFQNTFDDL